jgi:uncharacterized damage-inducible protein DinB
MSNIISFRRISVSRTNSICLMAEYNEWMNARLYGAAINLPIKELNANRNAFFGSILGTLNHLVVADTIWLKRFATHPANYAALDMIRDLPTPVSLDQMLFTDIQSLSKHRKLLDQTIMEWAHSIAEHDLGYVLSYSNMKGIPAQKNFFSLVMHFFNHQTHHRGQATTLLSQAGVDVGVTDLLALIPNETVA